MQTDIFFKISLASSDFQTKDHCVLFFMEEMWYSVVERKSLSDKSAGKKYTASVV